MILIFIENPNNKQISTLFGMQTAPWLKTLSLLDFESWELTRIDCSQLPTINFANFVVIHTKIDLLTGRTNYYSKELKAWWWLTVQVIHKDKQGLQPQLNLLKPQLYDCAYFKLIYEW